MMTGRWGKQVAEWRAEHPLLPCPFCGGEASFGRIEYGEDSEQARLNGQSEFYFVNCMFCGADNCGIVGKKSPQLAAAHWNGRKP